VAATWRYVAFPLILPWRQEYWGLPLYFPNLTVGVLWEWPPGLPYQGRPLPPEAKAGGRELRHYAPGELKQWQAFQEYADTREGVEDILRALKGEPEEAKAPRGPWQTEDIFHLAWQLEMAEADQEAHLNRVDQGGDWLTEVLAPEPWEEQAAFAGAPGDKEILDPETARLRYLLWRREMEPHLKAGGAPLLLGRTSRAIFASLRQEGGGGARSLVRLSLPGCRSASEYQATRGEGRAPLWQRNFGELLGTCLRAATQGTDPEPPAQELSRWVREELSRQWPGEPTWFLDLEIWGREPEVGEGGEALLVWGGPAREVVAG